MSTSLHRTRIRLCVAGGLAFVLEWLVAGSLLAHSGGEVVSKWTETPIEIDGVLDEPEWAAAFAESSPLQDLSTDPQDWYQVTEGGGQGRNTNDGGLRVSRGTIDGDEDLLVRWATLWDDEYLYFGFDVIDDSPNVIAGDCEGRQSRDFDGIWLCFDVLHDAPEFEFPEFEFNTAAVADQGGGYAADDTYWEFVPLTERLDGCVFDTGQHADAILNDPLNNIVMGEITDTGYTAEIRLPWSALEAFAPFEIEPEDGLVFGFDITVMDVDGDPPTYAPPLGGAMSWSSDFENDNSPGVLGDLLLSDEPVLSESEPVFRRGDADGIGVINIADAVYVLTYLFGAGETPSCLDAADAGDTGQVSIATAVFLLNFLFSSATQPPLPGPETCGPDPTEDLLDCASYENC